MGIVIGNFLIIDAPHSSTLGKPSLKSSLTFQQISQNWPNLKKYIKTCIVIFLK